MIKFKPKLYSGIMSLLVIGSASASVLHSEYEKEQAKAAVTAAHYSELNKNWQDYKSEYVSQVEKLKDQNKLDMEATKATYYKLLSEQPQLIAQHTTQVAQNSYVASGGNSSSGSASSGTTVTKQVITVPKPKAATSTGAS